MKKPISFRWDEQFLARVDAARGAVPRAAFVRLAVDQFLSGGSQTRVAEERHGANSSLSYSDQFRRLNQR